MKIFIEWITNPLIIIGLISLIVIFLFLLYLAAGKIRKELDENSFRNEDNMFIEDN